MSKEIIFLVEEAPEGGYTAMAPDHSIFTEADNTAELRTAVQDAVRFHSDEAEQAKPRLPFSLQCRHCEDSRHL